MPPGCLFVYTKKPQRADVESCGQKRNLKIRDDTDAGFNAADGLLRKGMTEQLNSGGKLLLGEPFGFPGLTDTESTDVAAVARSQQFHTIHLYPKDDYLRIDIIMFCMVFLSQR